MNSKTNLIRYNIVSEGCLRVISTLAIVILCNIQLRGETKTLKDDLAHFFSKKTVVSKIVFGGKAIPPGLQVGYPVNTLLYPQSDHVVFRVEFGLVRTEIVEQQMTQRFAPGTTFRVGGIDLKDDRLEVKLETDAGESAKLKVMLGKGWQSQFALPAIEAQLNRVFVSDADGESPVTAALPAIAGATDSQQRNQASTSDDQRHPIRQRSNPNFEPNLNPGLNPNMSPSANDSADARVALQKPTPDNIPVDPSQQGRVNFINLLFGSERNRGCVASVAGSQATILYLGCKNVTEETANRNLSTTNINWANGLRRRGFEVAIYGNEIRNWSAPITEHGFGAITIVPSETLLSTSGLETLALITSKEEEKISTVTPGEREQWVSSHARSHFECGYQIGGRDRTYLRISCSEGGIYMIRSLTDNPQSSEALEIYHLGFTKVEETDGQMFGSFFVPTRTGLETPTPGNIPIRSTEAGRADFADLIYGKERARGCIVQTAGLAGTAIYVACPDMTEEKAMNMASPGYKAFAISLHDRGFTTAIYGTNTKAWAFSIDEMGRTILAVLSSDDLLRTYNLKSREILMKVEAEARAYRGFIESTTQTILEFAVAKHAKRVAGSTWTPRVRAEFSEMLKKEELFKKTLAQSPYIQRSSFWSDEVSFAEKYIGVGQWEPYAGDFAKFYMTSGSQQEDATMRAELVAEIMGIKGYILANGKAS